MKKCDKDDVKLYRRLQTQLRSISSVDLMDPKYRRLQYVRYSDDFIIGIIGSHKDAVRIQEKVRNFLAEELGLNMSNDKTSLTQITKKPIHFLGTNIISRALNKNKLVIRKATGRRGRIHARLSFEAPIRKLLDRLVERGFLRWNHNGTFCGGTALGRMINLDHATILQYYQSIINGILNFYSFADNRAKLSSIIHLLKISCALTLTKKYKLHRMAKTFKRFGKYLKDPESQLQLKLPKTFSRTRKFIINPPKASEVIAKTWSKKLTKSNLFKACVICGTTPAEMHHVRKLRELKKRTHLDWFTIQMAAINRKQVPLCKYHHTALHQNQLTIDERQAFQEGTKDLVRKP